ncbi:diaminopimelate decarboxylase [Candidatus Aerophobetes bacterium]|nr:diaminopimelate decarboxylase [Candidatus Aerophobetes bacterium]
MSHFHYRQDELFCENIPIQNIADKVGTPFYIYSYAALVDNFRRVEKAFSPFNPLICYSLKANPNLTLCRILSSLRAGADVVSGGELYTALLAGFLPEKIVYAGVGKTQKEIEFALKNNILLFNVESEQELVEIAKAAEKLKRKAPISIRINPDIDPKTHHYITTGKKGNKFGVSFETAERLYHKIAQTRTFEAKGIHMHIGSQITSTETYLKALNKLKDFIRKLQDCKMKPGYLDMGGGFGIAYEEGEKELCLEELARQISLIFPEDMHLILEPGRYIVGNAAALITKTLYRKEEGANKFLIVDAAMNDLVRPALYGACHRIIPIQRLSSKACEKVSIAGPICESADFFLKNVDFPGVVKGELLAILDTGAYGFSMSSNYNSRTRCAEVLVKGDKWWLIREREDYQDLLRGQRVPRESLWGMNISSTLSCNVQFWKMEGTGNDFIVIDNRGELIKERAKIASCLCQRKKGIGADGLILIEEAKDADFTMRIFNPDGSEAEMCGNGARCAVRFAYLKGIAGRECIFQTLSGKILAKLSDDVKVKVKMTSPQDLREVDKLNIDGKIYKGYYVNTGVPHFVLFLPSSESIPIREVGAKIRFHEFFHPQGTNVDFVQIEKDRLLVRTYERGVEDETLSCGTGAVASALISAFVHGLSSPVTVLTKGGEIVVWFKLSEDKFSEVFLEAEANIVYRGNLNGAKYV